MFLRLRPEQGISKEMKPSVTITLTRYAEPDSLVRQALSHALSQQGVLGEVLFIDQQMDAKLGPDDFPGPELQLRVVRKQLKGLSQARNLALDQAKHPIVIFLDADALAQPDFAANLAAELTKKAVGVAGARIIPRWSGEPPFLAKARAVYDQFSLLDLGAGTKPYHRVVGAGFGVDMAKLPSDFRFDEALGRRDGLLFGGEESDFCTRAQGLGLNVRYVGGAQVLHIVEPERMQLRWIMKRLVYAGHGRAKMGGTPSPGGKAKLADWLLMPLYLPPYAAGWLWGKMSK